MTSTALSILLILVPLVPSEETIQPLRQGEVFTAPYSGAYVSDAKAAQIRQICEQHRLEAVLAKQELQDAQTPDYFWWALGIALTIGFGVGWGTRSLK